MLIILLFYKTYRYIESAFCQDKTHQTLHTSKSVIQTRNQWHFYFFIFFSLSVSLCLCLFVCLSVCLSLLAQRACCCSMDILALYKSSTVLSSSSASILALHAISMYVLVTALYMSPRARSIYLSTFFKFF